MSARDSGARNDLVLWAVDYYAKRPVSKLALDVGDLPPKFEDGIALSEGWLRDDGFRRILATRSGGGR